MFGKIRRVISLFYTSCRRYYQMRLGGGIWAGMPVSLKREVFYRILNDEFQYDLFLRLSESGEKFIEKELSEKEIKSLLHL